MIVKRMTHQRKIQDRITYGANHVSEMRGGGGCGRGYAVLREVRVESRSGIAEADAHHMAFAGADRCARLDWNHRTRFRETRLVWSHIVRDAADSVAGICVRGREARAREIEHAARNGIQQPRRRRVFRKDRRRERQSGEIAAIRFSGLVAAAAAGAAGISWKSDA